MNNVSYYSVQQIAQQTKQNEIRVRWDIIKNKLPAKRIPFEKYGIFAVDEKDAKNYILIHKSKKK